MRFLIFSLFMVLSMSAFAGEDNAAYDRVMKTQTIRCGYGTSPPWIYKDLQTGEMKGLNVEIMTEVARQLDFKLEWPEETGWATLPADLASGRVDVACSMLWNDPKRGKQAAYTVPAFYTAIHLFSRADDARFTGKPEEINKPEIRIAVQEGDVNYELAKRLYPKATIVALPATGSWGEVYLTVVTGKADLTFGDAIAIDNFNKNNEKKLKRVKLPGPATVYGNSFAVGINDLKLKETLDNTVRYLIQTGAIETLTEGFRKQYPAAIVLPAKPYEGK